jgi:hypothetical protein
MKINNPVLPRALVGAIVIASVSSTTAETVTAKNYVRAETDYQFKTYVASMDNFGKFVHSRKPYDVKNQVTVRGNRDTLYSFGIFDLASPLTVTLPEPDGRYQSIMMINQDHSIRAAYGPKKVILTEEKVGTRYVFLAIRTFMDPNDAADVKVAHALQDKVITKQAKIGKLELPEWNKEEVEKMRKTINVVAATVTDSGKMFGVKEDLDQVYWMLGAALGWGGLPGEAATYLNVNPEKNDGKTAYTLTAKDVPVDAFWSVTLYDAEGWMPINEHNAYSFNNVTAKKGDDGSITIHFGGDPKADNFLPIVKGWNYIIRQYRPKKEILDGTWTFPAAVEAK